MQYRRQRTIREPAEVRGIGFFTGDDVRLRFLPAGPDEGIAFQRMDCPGTPPIPAVVENTLPRHRRTAIGLGNTSVEMIEHVMAALAGLRIDNCLVQLDGPEPPGLDGSAQEYADRLREAGIVDQDAPRGVLMIRRPVEAAEQEGAGRIAAAPLPQLGLRLRYHLDYGPQSPIPPQTLTLDVTPTSFISVLAFARTFIEASEVEALRAQGYGSRTTARDLLVIGHEGVIDNELRAPDECVRHKLLDCLGDLALLGSDICGSFNAERSGHRLNHEIVRRLKAVHPESAPAPGREAA